MTFGKRPHKKWDEQDVITGWRRYLCRLDRPGVTSRIKRQMRARERRTRKQETRAALKQWRAEGDSDV